MSCCFFLSIPANNCWKRNNLLTQSGDRLCFPETVCVVLGLLQGFGQTRAQGEEVERSLDLLLLLLRKRVQLGQNETGKDKLLCNLSQEDWSLTVTQLEPYSQNGSFQQTHVPVWYAPNTPTHTKTQTMTNGSLGPSGLQASSFFCFFLLFCRLPLSSSVSFLSLKDIFMHRRSCMLCYRAQFTEGMFN